jgi:hypothetical protein
MGIRNHDVGFRACVCGRGNRRNSNHSDTCNEAKRAPHDNSLQQCALETHVAREIPLGMFADA